MQAGKRVAIVRHSRHGLHKVGLFEYYARYLRAYRSDIEHLDLTKAGHVGDKPAHKGSDIHVLVRFTLKNFSCYQQILPEVFALRRSAFFVPVMQAGQQFKTSAVARAEATEIANIARLALQRTKHFP